MRPEILFKTGSASGPLFAVVFLTLSACSSAPPPPANEPTEGGEPEPKKRTGGLGVQSEIGAMNQEKVEATFRAAFPRLNGCYTKGTERVSFLGGEVRLAVRVTESGSTRWAYVKDSTLGDRTAESCMLDVLKGLSWPNPEGGEGLAEKSFSFEPGGDERPPIEWAETQLGAKFKAVRPKLAKCKKDAQTGALKVTMYVETSGKPKAVGVSGSDEKSDSAASCVVSELEHAAFASPGSWAAKVTFSVE